MGNSSTRSSEPPKLKTAELQEFSRQSLFSVTVVEKLYSHFYRIASSENDDGVIDLDEFCSKIHRSHTRSRMLLGLFNLFDLNTDGAINFREFLQGLSIFNKIDHLGNNLDHSPMIAAVKTKEQIGYVLRLLDMEKSKKIYLREVVNILNSGKNDIGLKLKKETLKKIVERTFQEEESQNDEEEYLSHEHFMKNYLKRPEVFDWLAPDMERIMQDDKKIKNKANKSRCLSV
jgi:Ca2+-binding EF-hand superfamily protein